MCVDESLDFCVYVCLCVPPPSLSPFLLPSLSPTLSLSLPLSLPSSHPLRYQSSSKPTSPSQKQFPTTDLSHSVSMDVPKELTKTPPPVNNGRVPCKPAGVPSQFKAVHHLTPPIDRHRAGHKKRPKSGKLTYHVCSYVITSGSISW